MVDIQNQDHSLEITKRDDGRTQIVFRKAILKGRVTNIQVLNTILIAAQLQTELYIEKLSRGAPLDVSEIKALKELADITKLSCDNKLEGQLLLQQPSEDADQAKTKLYNLLSDRLKGGSNV